MTRVSKTFAFRYSPGLVLLGRLDGGLETLSRSGSMTAKVERLAE